MIVTKGEHYINSQYIQLMRKRKSYIILVNGLRNKWIFMTIYQKSPLVKKTTLFSSWTTSLAIVWWIMRMRWQRQHNTCLLVPPEMKDTIQLLSLLNRSEATFSLYEKKWNGGNLPNQQQKINDAYKKESFHWRVSLVGCEKGNGSEVWGLIPPYCQ